ncbi:hypothetical protein BV898_00643 [Hypsibius exemplaris]|uniref:Uncharacterized protein n=1 Tax=Hypsibius exemplaris TaxID=2072580 RepID=A0A1W0XE16_HYPEX|nr:hypothetical protein BV898_00643 [Hypsibius exemplaris]
MELIRRVRLRDQQVRPRRLFLRLQSSRILAVYRQDNVLHPGADCQHACLSGQLRGTHGLLHGSSVSVSVAGQTGLPRLATSIPTPREGKLVLLPVARTPGLTDGQRSRVTESSVIQFQRAALCSSCKNSPQHFFIIT